MTPKETCMPTIRISLKETDKAEIAAAASRMSLSLAAFVRLAALQMARSDQ